MNIFANYINYFKKQTQITKKNFKFLNKALSDLISWKKT